MKKNISKVMTFMFIVGGLGISNSNNSASNESSCLSCCASQRTFCIATCREHYGGEGGCDDAFNDCYMDCFEDYIYCIQPDFPDDN